VTSEKNEGLERKSYASLDMMPSAVAAAMYVRIETVLAPVLTPNPLSREASPPQKSKSAIKKLTMPEKTITTIALLRIWTIQKVVQQT
jgi:hypothetical protein